METKQVIIKNKVEEKQFLKEAHKRGWRWAGCRNARQYKPSNYEGFLFTPYYIEIEDGKLTWDHIKKRPKRLTLAKFLESVDN